MHAFPCSPLEEQVIAHHAFLPHATPVPSIAQLPACCLEFDYRGWTGTGELTLLIVKTGDSPSCLPALYLCLYLPHCPTPYRRVTRQLPPTFFCLCALYYYAMRGDYQVENKWVVPNSHCGGAFVLPIPRLGTRMFGVHLSSS